MMCQLLTLKLGIGVAVYSGCVLIARWMAEYYVVFSSLVVIDIAVHLLPVLKLWCFLKIEVL